MPTDIEIARAAKLEPILKIAEKIGIPADAIATLWHQDRQGRSRLPRAGAGARQEQAEVASSILVTAINPTAAGEGKTTTSVGLADALRVIGKKSVVALREPSLGPCFGMKGGAAGGGYAQVVPMEEINLHFTGDFHAIPSAHNLLAAMIDNHIYWGNALGDRLAPRRAAPRRRHERPRFAPDRRLARRRRQRLSARERFRHHRRLRGDGDLLPGPRSRGSAGAARQDRRRLYARQEAGDGGRPQGARRDDRAAQGCAGARIWCRRSKARRPSSTAARSPISRMAAIR